MPLPNGLNNCAVNSVIWALRHALEMIVENPTALRSVIIPGIRPRDTEFLCPGTPYALMAQHLGLPSVRIKLKPLDYVPSGTCEHVKNPTVGEGWVVPISPSGRHSGNKLLDASYRATRDALKKELKAKVESCPGCSPLDFKVHQVRQNVVTFEAPWATLPPNRRPFTKKVIAEFLEWSSEVL